MWRLMSLVQVAAVQSEGNRILIGCIAVVIGVAVLIANARSRWLRDAVGRGSRLYFRDKLCPVFTTAVRYAYYVGGAAFVVIGLLAITDVIS